MASRRAIERRERFKKKESIKEVPFGEFFHYLLKNYNLLTAIIYSLTPYVKILSDNAVVCAVGNEDKIKAAADMFATVENIYKTV